MCWRARWRSVWMSVRNGVGWLIVCAPVKFAGLQSVHDAPDDRQTILARQCVVLLVCLRIIRGQMKTIKKLSLAGLRFRCTGCGACCTGRGDYYVGVSRDEQERIRRFLKISRR